MSNNTITTVDLTPEAAIPELASLLRRAANEAEELAAIVDTTGNRLTDAGWELERYRRATDLYHQALDGLEAVASNMEAQAEQIREAYGRNSHVGEKHTVVN